MGLIILGATSFSSVTSPEVVKVALIADKAFELHESALVAGGSLRP
jgi:hypothetical protein